MRRWSFLLLPLLLLAGTSRAADDVVAYDLDARLDAASHRILATETVRWTNPTAEPASDLWFHLYLNAFANADTTFMQEMRRGWGRGGYREPEQWGWTRITRLETDDGTDLLGTLEFRQPDDANSHDRTVARVPLPRPVPPGASVTLHLTFEAQLPSLLARTGFAGPFHMVGQWYPKLGVFQADPSGGQAAWNCHQFHADSEFFADFGSYRVTLAVPAGWVLAGSGVEVRREEVKEGSDDETRVTYRADKVHDFAWSAAPPNLMTVVDGEFDPARDVPQPWLERTMRLLGRSAAELELPPTHLRLVLPQAQRGLAERILRDARLALAWLGLRFGPYPYPQLTLVSPPVTAVRSAGGMEYPTLVTIGASRWNLYPPRSWTGYPEVVTVHEIGHQWFYGLLASNEFEEPWLDEGLTSYVETACLADIASDGLAPDVRVMGGWGLSRLFLRAQQLPVPLDQPAWQFRTSRAYALASYTEPSVALHTVERQLGAAPFARALRAYAERFRYRHPTAADLLSALSEAGGADVSWFGKQVLRGRARPDWAVLSVRSHRDDRPRGYHWRDGTWQEAEKEGKDENAGEKSGDEAWSVEVDIGRPGALVAPVTVELTLEDGSTRRMVWDSSEPWTRWRVEAPSRAAQVVIDPDGDWPLETNRANNYWREESGRRRLWELLWWAPAGLWTVTVLPLLWS